MPELAVVWAGKDHLDDVTGQQELQLDIRRQKQGSEECTRCKVTLKNISDPAVPKFSLAAEFQDGFTTIRTPFVTVKPGSYTISTIFYYGDRTAAISIKYDTDCSRFVVK